VVYISKIRSFDSALLFFYKNMKIRTGFALLQVVLRPLQLNRIETNKLE
jgi:hypothetical protein